MIIEEFIKKHHFLNIHYLVFHIIEAYLDDIAPGVWQIVLNGEEVLNGRYDAWMTQQRLLKKETRFLNPDPFITIVTPATARNIITTGFYDQETGKVFKESGRGFTRDGRTKPSVITGASRRLTTGLENKLIVASGSAVAGSILTGTVALMFQWGVVEGNNPNIFGQSLRNYIIGATEKDEGVSYPNPEEGYGKLDIPKIFESLGNIKPSRSSMIKSTENNSALGCNTLNYEESHDSYRSLNGGLYINIPKEIYEKLMI